LNRKWARSIAERCIEAVGREDKEGFWNVLNPVLDSKVPFPLLDEIGKRLGKSGKREMPKLSLANFCFPNIAERCAHNFYYGKV
jgi:hypothetical protein